MNVSLGFGTLEFLGFFLILDAQSFFEVFHVSKQPANVRPNNFLGKDWLHASMPKLKTVTAYSINFNRSNMCQR